MQTQFSDVFLSTPEGREAQTILGKCVHCGFCNAVCPTYQLLGDELDGPRGRIYLIKQLLEQPALGNTSLVHLDRCLTCRACETACPSGVQYGRLLDIGRQQLAQRDIRPWRQRLFRTLLLQILPYRRRFALAAALARRFAPLLPHPWRRTLPKSESGGDWPTPRGRPRVLLLSGCVQNALVPQTDAAAARVLDKLGLDGVALDAGCCGALPYHLDKQAAGLTMMRRTIDRCWPHIETGIHAIVSTASGCGYQLKDYGYLLRNDPNYADKARHFSGLVRDLAEVLQAVGVDALKVKPCRVAFQAPCSLQHGQGLSGVVEALLTRLGFELLPVADAHLCCGSAGSYMLTQPELAEQLGQAKIAALQAGCPEAIASANIGCQLHLANRGPIAVYHWIDLLDQRLQR